MKVIIDTSSLLSLVRYYLPFDKNSILNNFFKEKVANGELIIIDKIIDECKYLSKGDVLTALPFLVDATFNKTFKLPLKTESIIPPAPEKFFRMVDNNFVIKNLQLWLTESEFEIKKNEFINFADIKLILTCLKFINELPSEKVFLITEETERNNDNKLFKKIPDICNQLQIKTKTLPELFQLYTELEVNYFLNNYII